MKDTSTPIKRRIFSRQFICLVVLMLGLSVSGQAQSSSTTSGNTPLGIAKGAPAGSYPLSGFESINPYNGALNFRLPLLHVGGRGGAGHTIQFVSEQHWRVDKRKVSGPTQYVYDPNPNWWSTLDAGFSPGTMVGRRTGISQAQGIEVYCPDNGRALTRFTFTAADGTEYEFRDEETNGNPMDNIYQLDPNNEFICNLLMTNTRGRVFVTSDGSAATFISDLEINDHSDNTDPYSTLPGELAYPTGYLFMRDGTCYRIDGGGVVWIRDRNGNRITFQYEFIGPNWRTTITDSLKRVVTIDKRLHDAVRDQDYDLIAYKGFSGADRTIKLWYSELKFALRPDFGTDAKTYLFLFPTLSGSAQTPFNPEMVAEIELPDGRKYFLKYNYYGELARVDLPTGGRIEYDYAPGVTGGVPSGVVTGVNSGGEVRNVYRRVTERRVYKDAGTTLELKETYSRPEDNSGGNQGYVEVQHLAGDGVTILARERHFYFGSPKSSFAREPYEYSNWKDGKEYQTKFYDKGAGGALLRTVDNTWQQPTAGNTWPLTGQGETSDTAKPNQPQITVVTTTLNDTSQSKETFAYDQFTNRTEVKEYDLGPSAPGSLIRRTATSYLTNNLNVNYTTVNPSTPSPDPNATVHIRSLPLQQSVYDNASTERARSTYEYDNYTEGLWDRSDITGHARMLGAQATHTATYFTRGNTTLTTNVVLGSPEVPLSTRMQYDIAGNVRSVTDPKSNTTTFEFNDRFGTPVDGDEAQGNTPPTGLGLLRTYAFATKVTNALSHVAYTQYDYYLGKPVNGEDANGVVAKGSYDDDLDRATELVVGIFSGSQLRRRTQFIYDDVARTITTRSDQVEYDDGLLRSDVLYDGLGRTTETRLYETTTANITTLQNYDGLGRVIQSSNPYRAGDTVYWTTTDYDGLSRVRTVTTPDGAIVRTDYNGSQVLVTDQALKKRISKTNALGQLTDVWEVTTADSATEAVTFPGHPEVTAGYRTKYAYDALDDLTEVTQRIGLSGTLQTRTFSYDSLKRLTRAINPESGTIDYTYDANSNLLTKLDMRSITTTYDYDALNRIKSRTYSSHVESTPPVFYKYDDQSLPSGKPPNFDAGFSTGRLVAVLYGSDTASNGSYNSYDQTGRVTTSFQQTEGQNYKVMYGYDLSGAMTSERYPSDKVVEMEYDPAGRLAGVKKDATTYYAGGSPGDAVNRISYASHGAMVKMRLGNGKWEHTNFNSRLQPVEIGLGNSSDSSILRLVYGYGSATTNNGNVMSQRIVIGGSFPLDVTQNYTYDPLNRLSTVTEGTGWQQTYDYDRFGNRAVRTGSHIPNATLTPISNDPPTNLPTLFDQTNNRIGLSGFGYDAAGNLKRDPVTGPNPPNGMAYDAENRQVSYSKVGGGGATNYSYDGDGRRVKKVDNTVNPPVTTVFVYNVGGQLIAEYTNSTSPPPGGGTSYLTTDHLGSTRVVTRSDGSVKARYDYLPFGEALVAGVGPRTGAMGYGGGDETRQRFTQKERDNESGLDYFLARYYSSAQGRFTTVDPENVRATSDDPQSWNGYVYTRNNPLKYIDPFGLWIQNADGNWVWQEGDTWKSLAKELGVRKSDLKKAFQGAELGPGLVLDTSDLNPGGISSQTYGSNGMTPLARGVLGDLDRSASASRWMIGGFGVGTAIIGATGGAALYAGGVMSGSGLTTLGLSQTGTGTAAGTGVAAAETSGLVLRPIHKSLSNTVLEYWQKKSTQEIIESLKPGMREALRVKPDGRFMNGNHRIKILLERGIDVSKLAREMVP